MNKTELVAKIAERTGLAKSQSDKVVKEVFLQLSASLAKGESVNLPGFGSFSISERAARTGRNPQTGKEIKIKASKRPTFKPGKAMKDAVNEAKAAKALIKQAG